MLKELLDYLILGIALIVGIGILAFVVATLININSWIFNTLR